MKTLTLAIIVMGIMVGSFISADFVIAKKPQKPVITLESFDHNTIFISWVLSGVPPSGDPQTEFRAEIKQVGGGSWMVDAILPANDFDHDYKGLDSDTDYRVRVKACNTDGCRDSNMIKVTTLPTPPPKIPIKSGSGGCDNCIPPTLGIQEETFTRVVDDGFSYNNKTLDVEYYANYLNINTTVGVLNNMTLKIYEDTGVQDIRHVGIGFGLERGEYFNEAQSRINIDFDFKGNITLSHTKDIKNATVFAEKVLCGAISTYCLEVNIQHIFTIPFDGDLLTTYIWDERRNAWQTKFFGFEINDIPKAVDLVEITPVEKTIIYNNNNGYFDRDTLPFDWLKKSEEYASKLKFQSLYGNITDWDD